MSRRSREEISAARRARARGATSAAATVAAVPESKPIPLSKLSPETLPIPGTEAPQEAPQPARKGPDSPPAPKARKTAPRPSQTPPQKAPGKAPPAKAPDPVVEALNQGENTYRQTVLGQGPLSGYPAVQKPAGAPIPRWRLSVFDRTLIMPPRRVRRTLGGILVQVDDARRRDLVHAVLAAYAGKIELTDYSKDRYRPTSKYIPQRQGARCSACKSFECEGAKYAELLLPLYEKEPTGYEEKDGHVTNPGGEHGPTQG